MLEEMQIPVMSLEARDNICRQISPLLKDVHEEFPGEISNSK